MREKHCDRNHKRNKCGGGLAYCFGKNTNDPIYTGFLILKLDSAGLLFYIGPEVSKLFIAQKLTTIPLKSFVVLNFTIMTCLNNSAGLFL